MPSRRASFTSNLVEGIVPDCFQHLVYQVSLLLVTQVPCTFGQNSQTPVQVYALMGLGYHGSCFVMQEVKMAAVARRLAAPNIPVVVDEMDMVGVKMFQDLNLRVDLWLEVLVFVLFLNSSCDVEFVIQVLYILPILFQSGII